jgi:hypothetical protein
MEKQSLLEKLGPQHRGDNSLTARMRLHQSWWRAYRLGVGWGKNRSNGLFFGNYLNDVDADRGLNFLSQDIYRVVCARIQQGPGVEPFRCKGNLMSSQPMAFNLFGLLCLDKDLATRLLDPLLPGGVSEATVLMEWAPDKKKHLRDSTSFDIAIKYKTRIGASAIAGVETKLTEKFTPKVYGCGNDQENIYRDVAKKSQVWLNPMDADFLNKDRNQIWRNHLLVESIRQSEPNLLGSQIVVHHPLDKGCSENIEKYSSFLSDPDATFRGYTLSHLVATWRPLLDKPEYRAWLNDFEARYLRFELSDEAAGLAGSRLHQPL